MVEIVGTPSEAARCATPVVRARQLPGLGTRRSFLFGSGCLPPGTGAFGSGPGQSAGNGTGFAFGSSFGATNMINSPLVPGRPSWTMIPSGARATGSELPVFGPVVVCSRQLTG